MPSTGLPGSWLLEDDEIDRVVTKKSPGNYALGRLDGKVFRIAYVGRSDEDLNARLHSHVGAHPYFKALYASSPQTAFIRECENYHDFTPIGNAIHPDRPAGTNWSCPRCRQLD